MTAGKEGKLTWSSNDTNVSEEELFDEVAYRFDDIVKLFFVRMVHVNESTDSSSYSLNVSQKSNRMISDARHRNWGKCYTFSPDDDTRGYGIYYLRMQL